MTFLKRESKNVKMLRKLGLDRKNIKKIKEEIEFYKVIVKSKKHTKQNIFENKNNYEFTANLLKPENDYHVLVKVGDEKYYSVLSEKILYEKDLNENIIKIDYLVTPDIVKALTHEFLEQVPTIGSKICLTNFLLDMTADLKKKD